MRFRSISICLILLTAAHGHIPTLSEGRDLNHAVNPIDVVYAAANQAGPSLYAIDGVKHTLVRARFDPPRNLGEPELLMDDLPEASQLLSADIDQDGEPDAVLTSGLQGFIWQSGLPPGESNPHQFDLPSSAFTGPSATPPAVADFDQDGFDDLLVPPPPDTGNSGEAPAVTDSPGWIVFSFGTSAAETVPLPTTRAATATIAPAFETNGGPVIALSSENSTEILDCTPDRLISKRETIPFTGVFAELDGIAPPELVHLKTFSQQQHSVRQRSDGDWLIVKELATDLPFSLYPVLIAVADFDSNGKDELIFGASPYLFAVETDNPETELRMLKQLEVSSALGEAGDLAITYPPSFDHPIRSIDVLRTPDLSPSLIGYRPSSEAVDFLGNPTTRDGGGFRVVIRNNPFYRSSRDEWHPFASRIPADAALGTLSGANPSIGIVSTTGRTYGLNPATDTHEFTSFDHSASTSIMLIDLNGDGLDDPVVANSTRVRSLITNTAADTPDLTFGSSAILSNSESEAPTRVIGGGDFDQDGDEDPLVVRASDETLGWLESDGDTFGEFHPIALAGRAYFKHELYGGRLTDLYGQPGYRWIGREQTVVTDIDQDGDPDVITFPSALGYRVALHRNNSVGFSIEPFGDPLPDFHPSDTPAFPRLFHGVFRGSDSEIAVLQSQRNSISGLFSHKLHFVENETSSPGALAEAEVVIDVDLDSDGLTDFVTTRGPTTDQFGLPLERSPLFFQRNLGGGDFARAVPLTTPRGLTSRLLAADFDGDGHPDIASISNETGLVELFIQEPLDPLPPFDTWIATYEITDQAADADPDRDGQSNVLEYLFNTHPNLPNSSIATHPPPIPEPFLGLNYPGRIEAKIPRPRQPNGDPVRVILESSSDLKHWTPSEQEPRIINDPAHPLWEILYWNHESPAPPAQNPAVFHRFRILPSSP